MSYIGSHYDLPSLENEMTGSAVVNLPQIPHHFFVPRLANKPQNPITDTLKQTSTKTTLPTRPPFHTLPPEIAILTTDSSGLTTQPAAAALLWPDAATRKIRARNQTLSWDQLRPLHPTKASPTAFLSEQESLVFAASRYHAWPRLRDPDTDINYISQTELLKALKMTVLGTSSIFHRWDSLSEQFIPAGVGKGRRTSLLLDGKDEVISESVISRFLTIGTLLRRLETLLATVRTRSAKEGPTIHAYAHALSTIISFLRGALARSPPSNDILSQERHTLTAIWIHYGIYEEILVALSALYERDMGKSPEEYPSLTSTPEPLLSHIYDHLHAHIERQSPRIIAAIFAFILTSASQEYLQQVSRSVGFGGKPTRKSTRVVGERNDQYSTNFLDDEDQNQDDMFDNLDSSDTFPTFFPQELVDVLPAAQKSLILLRAAQPDHPLLNAPSSQGAIKWFWTELEIEAAWSDKTPQPHLVGQDAQAPLSALEPPISFSSIDAASFARFRIFDLEPGFHLSESALGNDMKHTSAPSLQTFIDIFPSSLPPITPTLAHLTSLVFARLVRHASTLSGELLALFLSSSGTLNFQAHLVLLRSYLLLTSPPFKSRLAAALFSDSGDCDGDNNKYGMFLHSMRRRPSKRLGEGGQPWAVGLAPALLERETWPPVGADLSFFLRTVIVDSFETGKSTVEGAERQQVLEEAEYRLGFAIRDLPVGPGRDKWLNPLSIEALDFLYMDYKPPHPLEVLITPEILSKYQRLSAFILRLMRVESAVVALFRMTRTSSDPLFPTLVVPSKMLTYFRFIAQSFVSNLSEYVFDTAIAGNFDPFVARLTSNTSSTLQDGKPSGFSDVFELAKGHSVLLDDILSACLLRSGQRAVGDLLRHALELILEFSIIAGELKRGKLEEYQAALALQDLFQKFRAKMSTLVRVLEGLVDKGSPTSRIHLDNSTLGSDRPILRPTGGTEALHQLLIRLDLGDWWAKKK